MSQPDPLVNPVEVKEAHMSFIHFMPALSLLQSLQPPVIPFPFLADDLEFQNTFKKALEGHTSLRAPWFDGYGKLFWNRYAPDREPSDLRRALVPMDFDIGQHITGLTLTDCTVDLRVYLYLWGMGILVDITLNGSWPLKDAVSRMVAIHNNPEIHWTSGKDSGNASPQNLADVLRQRLHPLLYGDKVRQEQAGDQFSIVTVTDASNVEADTPLEERGAVHHALDGLTSWNRNWAKIKPPKGSLAECRISSRTAPDGHILYGRPRARAVWFPADFRSVASYPPTLSCYHQNLSAASLHTEALCVLAEDAAAQLKRAGSLAAFSVAYRNCAQLAAGILGRLHGKKTDDAPGKKPLTYRSGSLRSQMLAYSSDINQLRMSFSSINSPLDQ
ncbi:MAG: hypothetical protein WBM14_05730 [Terracidiphilus sp.]|jgi:hypothetical protein